MLISLQQEYTQSHVYGCDTLYMVLSLVVWEINLAIYYYEFSDYEKIKISHSGKNKIQVFTEQVWNHVLKTVSLKNCG